MSWQLSYLPHKAVLHAKNKKKNIVVSWRNEAKCSVGTDVTQLASSYEEADTTIILHSLNVSSVLPLSTLVHQIQTYLFYYCGSQFLPPGSVFKTRIWANRRSIELNFVYAFLNPKQVKAILGLNALPGCDITSCFKNRGNQYYWNLFQSSEDVLEAFYRFGCPESFTSEDENC